eukprot:TRINITY_DN32358_c0_g1_i1.p1 TRINITY_DN32358_c0_g1~~TRINITY_DN32358_c0_g1_i1.p1  ORF type:complete len:666 (-),score=97.23 TRINITY_DN32358_c0_g1_i1:175-1995(-)
MAVEVRVVVGASTTSPRIVFGVLVAILAQRGTVFAVDSVAAGAAASDSVAALASAEAASAKVASDLQIAANAAAAALHSLTVSAQARRAAAAAGRSSGSSGSDSRGGSGVRSGDGSGVGSGDEIKAFSNRTGNVGLRVSAIVDSSGGLDTRPSAAIAQRGSLTDEDGVVSNSISISPDSGFVFSGSDTWTLWPGLEKTITVLAPGVVLVYYQTSCRSAGSPFYTKLKINDKDIKSTRSVAGKTEYATNIGIFADFLDRGKHKIQVMYRTLAKKAIFDEGGEDWQQRSLQVLMLPEATVRNLYPEWEFWLSSTNLWYPWQGLETEMTFREATPVLAFFSVAMTSKNQIMVSRFEIDGHESPQTRSVAGENYFAQQLGFFASLMEARSHNFGVSYRSPARSNVFVKYGGTYQTRVMGILSLPGAKIYSAYDGSGFDLVAGKWTRWPGLSKNVTIWDGQYLIATYSVSLESSVMPPPGKYSSLRNPTTASVFSKLFINGVEQPQTRSACGETRYCQQIGFWIGALPAGTNTFEVWYKTPTKGLKMRTTSNLTSGTDFETRALNVIVLNHVEIVDTEKKIAKPGDFQVSLADLGDGYRKLQEIDMALRGG